MKKHYYYYYVFNHIDQLKFTTACLSVAISICERVGSYIIRKDIFGNVSDKKFYVKSLNVD